MGVPPARSIHRQAWLLPVVKGGGWRRVAAAAPSALLAAPALLPARTAAHPGVVHNHVPQIAFHHALASPPPPKSNQTDRSQQHIASLATSSAQRRPVGRWMGSAAAP